MISTLPNRTCERISTATLVGVLFAIAMVVLAIPASAHATPGAQRCLSVAALDATGLRGFLDVDNAPKQDWNEETLEEVASTDRGAPTPCGLALSDDEDSDPSFNLCFESVEEPISTLPRFIAQWRGEKEAAMVVDSILRALESTGADRKPAGRQLDSVHLVGSTLVAISTEVAPRRDAPAEDRLMCTTIHLEQCHALPPPAESMEIAAVAGVPIPRHQFEPDSAEPSRNIRPWADLRVGPQAGHPRVPEQPPRA